MTARYTPMLLAFTIFSTAAFGDPQKRKPRQEDSMLDVLMRSSLLSWSAGLGHGRNVYLTSSGEKDDVFFEGAAEYECRLDLGQSSELYITSSLERRQYFNESKATESFFDFFTEYYARIGPAGLGVSDALAWEDFRTFDEEGGTVPAGEYESLANKVRCFVTVRCGKNHDVETGFAFRTKDYASADYDFQEAAVDFAYTWQITGKYRAKLSMDNRTQDYDERKALSVDGSSSDTNPTLEVDTRATALTLRRSIGRFTWVDVFVEQTEHEENWEKEGAYEQQTIGCGCLLELGTDYTLETALRTSARDYEQRTVPTSGAVQKDDFLTLNITLERRLKDTTSIYLKVENGERDSNDPDEDYAQSSVAIGLKGMF